MLDEILDTQDRTQPPPSLSRPMQALWWVKKGGFKMGPEWEQAHQICQTMEGNKAHDWVHALCHWIEADFGNSDYWYRQAGERRHAPNVAAEWEYLVGEIGGPAKARPDA